MYMYNLVWDWLSGRVAFQDTQVRMAHPMNPHVVPKYNNKSPLQWASSVTKPAI